jgi:acetyl esterase/lipase
VKLVRVLTVATILIASAVFAQDPPPLDLKGYTFDKDLAYGTQSPKQVLDILYPAVPDAAPRPAIIHIHGGGWYTGGKDGDTTLRLMHAFAEKGYVALSIAYRLSDEAPFPAAVEDCRLAVRWLRANAAKYHVDPDHIGAMGGSAGGHLSAMLAVCGDEKPFDGAGGLLEYSSAIQAAVPVCGPMDLQKPLSAEFGLEKDDAVMRFLGGTPLQKVDEARRASPVNYVRPGLPPMILIHGDADKRVALEQSTDFAAKLKEAGCPVEMIVVKDGHHGMAMARTPEMLAHLVAFFDQYLKPSR